MGQPAARITDVHACPVHGGGPIVSGSLNVLIGNLPAARVSDTCICYPVPDTILRGSSGVFVNNLPSSRMGDSCAHGGAISSGLFTVLIGEVMGGPAGPPATAQCKCLKAAADENAPFCEEIA